MLELFDIFAPLSYSAYQLLKYGRLERVTKNMPEQLLKYFSIDIEHKLYQQETPNGQLAIYQTIPFGKLLMLDGQVILSEADSFFYHEMITHPVLFNHPKPQKILIVGNSYGILQEVLKHSMLSEIHCVDNNVPLEETIKKYFPLLPAYDNDPRIVQHNVNANEWLAQHESDVFDIIIQTEYAEKFSHDAFSNAVRLLKSDGIAVQPCSHAFHQFKNIQSICRNMMQAGFKDVQLLNFLQPSFRSGWRSILMATKHPVFKPIREKDVYNRTFKTRYYNFDMHKAALVLPEFMREELDW